MFALYLVQKKEWKGCYLFLLNVVYNLLCNILAVSLIAEGNIEYITSAKSYFTTYLTGKPPSVRVAVVVIEIWESVFCTLEEPDKNHDSELFWSKL